jgi:hypothetical protein
MRALELLSWQGVFVAEDCEGKKCRQQPQTMMTKTWCRASERLATVVTSQTFYMRELKRLKNETLVS